MTDAPTAEPHEHPVDPERVAHARSRGLSSEDAGRLISLLSLLADPVRARILYALDQVEELCVGDMALALGATEDAVGYALRLRRARRSGSTRNAARRGEKGPRTAALDRSSRTGPGTATRSSWPPSAPPAPAAGCACRRSRIPAAIPSGWRSPASSCAGCRSPRTPSTAPGTTPSPPLAPTNSARSALPRLRPRPGVRSADSGLAVPARGRAGERADRLDGDPERALLGPADDPTAVTAAQLRAVVGWLQSAGAWHVGDPPILVVLDSGYDVHRLAFLLADLPLQLVGRIHADRVLLAPAPPPRRDPRGGQPRRHEAVMALPDPGSWPEPTMTSTTETARYGTAAATSWDRLHPRLTHRGPGPTIRPAAHRRGHAGPPGRRAPARAAGGQVGLAVDLGYRCRREASTPRIANLSLGRGPITSPYRATGVTPRAPFLRGRLRAAHLEEVIGRLPRLSSWRPAKLSARAPSRTAAGGTSPQPVGRTVRSKGLRRSAAGLRCGPPHGPYPPTQPGRIAGLPGRNPTGGGICIYKRLHTQDHL